MRKFIKKTPVLALVIIILVTATIFGTLFSGCTPTTQSDDDNSADTDKNTDNNLDENEDNSSNQDSAPKKYVAFTFDDGPSYDVSLTKKYIDELAKYDGRATFFLIGERVVSIGASGLKYAVNNGWELGIHAYSHQYSYGTSCNESVYNAEVDRTAAAIHKYLPKYDIKLLRPPYGDITPERAKSSPYSIILWSVSAVDWDCAGDSTAAERDKNVQKIVDNVLSGVKDGSIILMHEPYNNTFLAFCEILKELDKQGYEFVTVSELLGDKLEAGKKFYKR